MNNKKHTISLCMGSSCYVNGNVPILQYVQSYIQQHGLEQVVELKGSLCQGHCKNGPSVILDGTQYTHVTMPLLQALLEKTFMISRNAST